MLSFHSHCLPLQSNMAVLWHLLFLTIGTAADFNPMELYLNSKEGVSFAFVVDGVKQYSYFWWQGLGSLSIGADYKNLGKKVTPERW